MLKEPLFIALCGSHFMIVTTLSPSAPYFPIEAQRRNIRLDMNGYVIG